MLDVYLEFRITRVTDDGRGVGVNEKDKENSIRWKKLPIFGIEMHEMEGNKYDIFLVGTYDNNNTDIALTSLIVKAVSVLDPSIIIYTQIGGIVPVVDPNTGDLIEDIPLHITTEMVDLFASIYPPPEWGVDNRGPMEGGIRPQIEGYLPADELKIAEAVIEYNVVHHLYEYIPFTCNPDFAEFDLTATSTCG